MAQKDNYKFFKVKFLKSLANLPEKLREDVLAVVDEKPFSWNAAAIEIKNDTDTGKKIIKILLELEII